MLSLVIFTSSPRPAQAIFCGNCKNFAQGVFDSIKEAATTIFTGTASVQQTIDTVNNKVLKPMKDAMTLTQIVKSGQMVNTLITASTGGDPLLISNPKLYLQNKGIAVTQGGVDSLASQNGVYSNSIMNSVVAKAKKNNSSLTTNLTAINQSSIPAMEKAKICNDTALSNMAKSQVAASGGDYLTVKSNLNSSLCTGNPSTDPALAKRLIAVSNKNPSLDTFYAITSGDNQYTKSQLSQIEIDKAAEAAKTAAAKDIGGGGGGIKSKTTCTKTASNGLCIEDTVKQASSVLNKAYTDSLGSDVATKISSIGSGAGSIIGTAFNAISLFKGLTSVASSLTGTVGGSSGGSGNSSKLGTVTIPTGAVVPVVTNTTTASSNGYAQDLKNNPQSKKTITDSIKDLLKYHQKVLDDLRKSDNDYLSTITSYNSQLDSMKACYDSILSKSVEYVDEFGIKTTGMSSGFPATESRMAAANSFYNQKKNINDTKASTIRTELKKIDLTSTLVINTSSIVDNSNSTDEIAAIFKDYQDTVNNQDLPDMNSGASKIGEQMTFAGELQISTIDGGEIFNLNTTCTSMKQELDYQNNRD